jgi:hypothetical protein
MNTPTARPATLVFPAVNGLASDYWRTARQLGEPLVLAASVACDPTDFAGESVLRLPMVHDDSFASALLVLIEQCSIRRIFCPVASVYSHLQAWLPGHAAGVELVGDSPIRRQVEQHRELMRRARSLRAWMSTCAGAEEVLPEIEVAALLRQAGLVHGESSDEKLAAMIAIAASAPAGDLVEIGALMGRTALVLLSLARRYRLGPLLTVDPWQAAHAIHQESPANIGRLVEEWDYEILAEAFFVNLAPWPGDDHAHLRLPSAQAHAIYAAGLPLANREAVVVPFARRIAILHVDGNHDHAAVKQDCELWLSHLLPGGWLVLDDYQWAHGDGPQRVGDDLLAACSQRIERAFVCGKALFIKLGTDPTREE